MRTNKNISHNTTYERDAKPCSLVLPSDPAHIKSLREKLDEYKIKRENSPYLAPAFIKFFRNDYKIAILERLLERGTLEPDHLAHELRRAGDFDQEKFDQAVGIIRKHCETKFEPTYASPNLVFAG